MYESLAKYAVLCVGIIGKVCCCGLHIGRDLADCDNLPICDGHLMDVEGALLSRITVDPRILVGKPSIRGLRISVEQILKALANGVPVEDLLEDYPGLESADIQAALAYAAELVAEEKAFAVETA